MQSSICAFRRFYQRLGAEMEDISTNLRVSKAQGQHTRRTADSESKTPLKAAQQELECRESGCEQGWGRVGYGEGTGSSREAQAAPGREEVRPDTPCSARLKLRQPAGSSRRRGKAQQNSHNCMRSSGPAQVSRDGHVCARPRWVHDSRVQIRSLNN